MKNNIIVCSQIAFISISVISCGGGGGGAPNVPSNLTINGTASQPAIPNTPVDINQPNVLDNAVSVNEQPSSPSSQADGNGSGATPNQPVDNNHSDSSEPNSGASENSGGSTATSDDVSNNANNGSSETSPSNGNDSTSNEADTNAGGLTPTEENQPSTGDNTDVADGSGTSDVNHGGTENPSNGDNGTTTSEESNPSTGDDATATDGSVSNNDHTETTPNNGDGSETLPDTHTNGSGANDESNGGEETSPNPPVEDNTAPSVNDTSGEPTQPNSGATESDATNNTDTSVPSENGENTNTNPPAEGSNGTSDVNNSGTENPSNDGSGSTLNEADTNAGGLTPTEENQPSAGDNTDVADGNGTSDVNHGSSENPSNGDSGATTSEESNSSAGDDATATDGNASDGQNNDGSETSPNNGDGLAASGESEPTQPEENGQPTSDSPNTADGSVSNNDHTETTPNNGDGSETLPDTHTNGSGSSNENNGSEETSSNPPVEDNTTSPVNDTSGEPSEPNSGTTESDATNNADTSAPSENGESTNANPPAEGSNGTSDVNNSGTENPSNDGSGSTLNEADTNAGGLTPTEESNPSTGDDATATDGNASDGQNNDGSETSPNNGDGLAASGESEPTQPEENGQPTSDSPNTADGSVSNNDHTETTPNNGDGSAASGESESAQPEGNGQPTSDSSNTADGGGSGDVNDSGMENPSNGDNGATTSEESNPSTGDNSNTAGSGSSDESNGGEETSSNPPAADGNASGGENGSGSEASSNQGGGSDVPPSKPDEVVNPPENTDSPVADDVPVNNPPETRVERYRPENMEATNHDENTVMKISVIDVDFSNKNDTYDAFKRPDGRLRLHLNQGTDRVAKGNNKSHGTMVAGVIAKHNSTSEIYGYTTDSNGNVSVTNLDFEAAYNNGVRIFNNSWGNNVEDDRYRLESVWKDRLGYPNAIDEFIGKKAATDSIFIFATGNDRKIRPKTGNYPTTQSHYPVEYPEAKRGFLAVTSVAWGDQSVRDYANKLGPLAKYWGIASYGEHSLFNNEAQTQGTSFATPVVSAAVADVWEKFPWMNNHLVVQSILSTADKPKSNGVVTDGPNEDTGWGVLNKDRALKGPARFDRRLLTDSDNGYVVADFAYRNYDNPDRLTFSNNIAGDAGFKKRGTGMLYFTGNNSYTGDTIVEKGYLSVAGDLSHSKVSIEKEGTLIAKNDEKKVRFGDSSVADYVVSNKGSLEVLGKGLTITGNYQATADARTVIDINTASLDVTGTADMGGSRIVAHIEKVQEVPKKEHEKTILTAGTLSNYHNDYAVSDYVNPYIQIKELKQDNNHVKVKFVRNNTDAVLNALALGNSSSRNTGRNLDKAFDEVANNPNSALSSQAVSILNASPLALGRTIDSLSAEIYASAPNAVWNQSIANKQKNAERVLNDHAGVWADTGYNTYKIAQNGFASGDSKAHQTSFGVDKQFDNLMLGVSVNTGEIKTDFDRSAGNSKIRTHGIHVHGGVNWNPWYAFANVGMSWTQNKVNRSLNIANNADKIDLKQNGKIYHLYGEVGYQFNHFTPFVAYSLDSVHQNAINEGKTFGIQAPARTHNISSYIAGVRSSVNIKDLRLNASLAHIYTPKADFDFTAKFVGASHDIDIKGVQVARHQTMMNAGFYYPMSEAWSVFGSYSLSRNKYSNHQGIHLGAKYRF